MADQISTRIRAAREDAGLTRERMAPMVGVTMRTLSRWETGETPGISVDALSRIAAVTGKPVSWFLNGGPREETRA